MQGAVEAEQEPGSVPRFTKGKLVVRLAVEGQESFLTGREQRDQRHGPGGFSSQRQVYSPAVMGAGCRVDFTAVSGR